MKICPACKSNSVRKSHKRGWIEHLNYILFTQQPYRCSNCDNRFLYTMTNRRNSRTSKTRQQRQIKEIAVLVLLGLLFSMITLHFANKDSAPPPPPPEASP